MRIARTWNAGPSTGSGQGRKNFIEPPFLKILGPPLHAATYWAVEVHYSYTNMYSTHACIHYNTHVASLNTELRIGGLKFVHVHVYTCTDTMQLS